MALLRSGEWAKAKTKTIHAKMTSSIFCIPWAYTCLSNDPPFDSDSDDNSEFGTRRIRESRAPRKPFRIPVLWLIVGICSILSLYVYHVRPLINSTSWTASLTHSDASNVTAKVYVMLGRPNILFIELPESHRNRNHWFSVALDRRVIAVPNGPHHEPYLSQHQDMALGVFLTDAKIEDEWMIYWSEHGVVFSNGMLKIELKEKA